MSGLVLLPPAPSTSHSNEPDVDGDFTSHFLLLPTTSGPCPRHGSLTTETSLATKPSGKLSIYVKSTEGQVVPLLFLLSIPVLYSIPIPILLSLNSTQTSVT